MVKQTRKETTKTLREVKTTLKLKMSDDQTHGKHDRHDINRFKKTQTDTSNKSHKT